ncbi:pentapeptide repeat-containing protein [Streptomyces sp. NPDC002120]|uniref:pentapeptide repeat-containing protein n=1 Tax=Streptomyces sp. NPDC002120 TaxID=3364631 RepID=UPI0036B0744B
MAAFLRTHLPWPPHGQDSPAADAAINSVPPLETRAANAGPTGSTSATPTCVGPTATGLWPHHVNFDGACLEAASIYRVDLTKASLIAADMRHVELGTSVLHQSRCIEADLRGARMVRADLGDAISPAPT